MIKTTETNMLLLLVFVFCQLMSVQPCALNEFECNTTKACIDIRLRCNDDFNCMNSSNPFDYSDELDCQRQYVCPENQFKCRNGLCVAPGALCNGIDQCPDGSDEDRCGECSLETSSFSYTMKSEATKAESSIFTIILAIFTFIHNK